MRMLLITGAHLFSDQKLRRLILRYTGSPRATRIILRRIKRAMRRGEIHTCMIHPAPGRPSSSDADDRRWEVLVSYLSPSPLQPLHG
jgi:hypothetical protein